MRLKKPAKTLAPSQKRRFPWVRPRTGPRIGQKYQLKHLQPLARSMFERLSALTDVPVHRLLPWRGREGLSGPHYQSGFHVIAKSRYSLKSWLFGAAVIYAFEGPKVSITQHESFHALLDILAPVKPIDFFRRATGDDFARSEEHYATIGSYRWMGAHFSKGGSRFQHGINTFYRKYGADGLLALFLRARNIGTLEDLSRFERELTEGRLLSKDGFTQEGEAWFRREAKGRVRTNIVFIRTMRKNRLKK